MITLLSLLHTYTRQILAALWGEPEVYRLVVKKHSACRLTVSVQHAINRIQVAL